tara:strand:+ start:235 stop:504 length:270 start_codon:yes stop_codon:yes gene_type:complete
MESKKLTKKELESIVNIQTRTQEIQSTFGAIAIRELELSKSKQVQEAAFTELRAEETELAKKLEDKYGSGNIDLDQGIFIPLPEPPVTA